jgi:N-acetylmuramoyl-L-alanine amidase
MTGTRCLQIAATRLGKRYVLGVTVPKNNPEWKEPWDCAEFCSWVIFQAGQILYGVDNHSRPDIADAYSGYFADDASELGTIISTAQAAATAGALLIRRPTPSLIGHVVFSDGNGGTIEAKGAAFGVVRGTLSGRRWDIGALVPGFNYDIAPAGAAPIAAPAGGMLYRVGGSGMNPKKTKEIQSALKKAGFDSGPADGIYGVITAKAAHAFQVVNGLVPDGEVGPETAKALKIKLP